MISKKDLTTLFQSFTQALANRLESGEATAADLGVIRQFLKDNNISVEPGDNSALDRLTKNLPFPSNTAEDAEKGLIQ